MDACRVPAEAGPEAQASYVETFATLRTIRLKNRKSLARRAVLGFRDILRVLRGKKVS